MPSPGPSVKNIFLIFAVFLIVAVAGLLSQPCLGDEISFYRLAKGFFEWHRRLAIDPVYDKSHLVYFYNSEPLWPALLGLIWTVLGRVSFAAAQIYHALYFLILMFCTGRFAEQTGSERDGTFKAVLFLAVTPMVAAFSILFYAEIPMMAFLMMGLCLFLDKKIFLASLALTAAYLTKATVLFFFPAFLWLLFQGTAAWKDKLKRTVLFFIPVIMAAGMDSLWRSQHLNITYLFSNAPETVVRQSAWQALKDRLLLGDAKQRLAEYANYGLWEYTNSSLLNLRDVLKYFGVLNLISALLFIFRKHYKRHRIETVFILSYLAGFIYTCILAPDIRYLLPIAPFVAVIAASELEGLWKKKTAKILILMICLMQFSGSVFYVVKERRISSEIQAGFSFIKQTVPEEMLTIYPEYVFIEKTDRGVVWSHRFRDKLKQLFWDSDKKSIVNYFVSHNIRYLAVKESRVYDDASKRNFGGYPESFVKELGLSPYFKPLFKNSEISIWQIVEG